MLSYSKNDVVLVSYPYSDLSGLKLRPAVVVSEAHSSQDIFLVPLTSRLIGLLSGEFPLVDWQAAGLNVPTAVKRGVYNFHQSLVVKLLGRLSERDAQMLQLSLRGWLGL
ncbi:MAG: MazF family transcriptional regulator [Terriglobia bacterium]|jgi:mRNA interferase MazF